MTLEQTSKGSLEGMGKYKGIIEGRMDKLRFENPSEKHVLRKNEPLPNEGACAHNKNSAKWFRYACCGRLFACSKSIFFKYLGSCHNSNTNHKNTSAPTIVCGHCSKEQPAKSHECNRCHKTYTLSVGGKNKVKAVANQSYAKKNKNKKK